MYTFYLAYVDTDEAMSHAHCFQKYSKYTATPLDATHRIIPYPSQPLVPNTISTTQGVSYKVYFSCASHHTTKTK